MWVKLFNSSAAPESSDPDGLKGPSYSKTVGTIFLGPDVLLSIYSLFSSLAASSVSLYYFVLAAVPMCTCFGKHSCMSSIFPIAMLNGQLFFFAT